MKTVEEYSSQKVRRAMPRTTLFKIGLAIAVLAVAAYFLFRPDVSPKSNAKAFSRRSGPVPVVIATAQKETVPVTIRAVGNAQALATVAIKSRVDGQIMKVHFKDGAAVKKGDLLYTIDPRPFQTQLRQSEAILARDRAQLENARVTLKRTQELNSKGYATQQQLDVNRTTVAAMQETIKVDEAAIAGVRLQLGFTEIRSPIDGRAADTQVDAGNLVKANDVQLVVINEIKPIQVAFFVPEQYAFEIRRRMATEELKVMVSVPKVQGPPLVGAATFITNSVDSSTGTVLLKATLPNRDGALLPGQFVNVDLQMATIPDALVVPSQAVQTGQKGDYVFVVKADDLVDIRPVTVGEQVGSRTVITSGIAAGEKIVIDGQLRLYPGAQATELKSQTNRPSQRKGRSK